MLKKVFPWPQRPQKNDKSLESTTGNIKAERIILRDKRIEDAAADYAWRTDEELARLDATKPLKMTLRDFKSFSKDELRYTNPSSRRYALETMEGRHIGNCMYYDIDERRGQAELGIMVGDRDYWDNGYGTEAVDAMLTHIFTHTSMDRVYLHTLEWNIRARRSFAKSGFREIKEVHRSGNNFVLMEVMRFEWKERKAAGNQADK